MNSEIPCAVEAALDAPESSRTPTRQRVRHTATRCLTTPNESACARRQAGISQAPPSRQFFV